MKNLFTVLCFPFSNQILGFTPDIRNHPAIHYSRSGIPIVLGSDDPGSYPDLIILTAKISTLFCETKLKILHREDLLRRIYHCFL